MLRRLSLVEEVGIDHGREGDGGEPLLRYPVYAERAADGTTLVVDELAIEKSLRLRAWYRTLVLDRDGVVVADSREWGMDDAFGFLAGDRLAVLRVTQWELVLLSGAGERVGRVDLSALSKRMPLVATQTPRATFLVAFADRLFDVDVLEVDAAGRLLWCLPRLDWLGYPGTAQLLPSGNVLLADEFCHAVYEVAPDGSIVQQVGRRRDPGRRGDRLSSPRAAWAAPGGARLVADTRNDRVLRVERDGSVEQLPPPADGLSSPTFATALPGGTVLVCDAGNRRVVEYDARGDVVARHGAPPAGRRLFSFPRSVEPLAGGALLVADTANDRVVVVDGGAARAWPAAPGELFWPRCARAVPGGSLLVADGRNSRVLELDRSGTVVRRLEGLRIDGGLPLRDPHDVRRLPNGNLLVTDSPLGLVVETNWSGDVARAIGGGERGVSLDDPHSGQPLPDGIVLVCDSGNDRLLRVGADGRAVSELRALRSGSEWFRLSGPRHAEISPAGMSPAGTLIVSDTGNNRVLGAESGEVVWVLSAVPGSPLAYLNQPRWAQLVAPNEVVVCDHCHHRVLRLRWERS